LQKGDLFNGLEKSQEMFEGFGLPQAPQSKKIQASAQEILSALPGLLGRLYDLEATKDAADADAVADVVVNGQVIIENVQINHLLWLEKQFQNLVTVFKAIPVISAAEQWQEAVGLSDGYYQTATETQPITKKVTDFKIVVPAAANGNHPADVREVSKDVQS